MARAVGEIRGLKAILTTADAVVLAIAWLPVLLIGLDDRRPAESLFVASVALCTSLFIMRYEGLYLSRLCAVRSIEVRLIARSTVYTALGLVLLDRMVFVHIDTVIRLKEVGIGATLMLVLLVVERSVFRSVLRSARQGGARGRDVLIIGSGAHAARLVSVIGDHPDYGMRVVGLVGDHEAATANGLGRLWMGTIDDTIEVALRSTSPASCSALPASEHPDITTLVKRLQRRQIHVQVSNGLAGFDVQRLRQLHLAHEPMIYLEASRPRRVDFIAKRVIDLAVSAVALLALSPVLVAASLMIKFTDRGPVLFKQIRVGRDGKLFNVYKFRTMVVDAEQRKAELMADNERSGPLFKMDVDPRVTRIGRFLRLSSLDEVPQLFNVVRGQMSIVGPRPALPSEVIEFDEELRRRELVKPGITGLWQVEARDSPSFDAYRRLDLFYVDNWTVVGDLEIMMDTAEHLLGRMVGQLRKRTPGDVVSITPSSPIDASSIRVREQHSTVA